MFEDPLYDRELDALPYAGPGDVIPQLFSMTPPGDADEVVVLASEAPSGWLASASLGKMIAVGVALGLAIAMILLHMANALAERLGR